MEKKDISKRMKKTPDTFVTKLKAWGRSKPVFVDHVFFGKFEI